MMESKTLVATMALATIITVSLISYILPPASAHGVQAQLQSRFVRIDNEQFSDQTLNTGDELTVTGQLTSLVN
ncbi:MAG: ammonia monooxygenase, partial [Thermoproteota archaeon]|nr:ammonia monooxygenase [Thermoproteota archaeon]